MGSGDRIVFQTTEAIGFGVSVSRFPFAITVNFHFLVWHLCIGFGKGYDQ